MCSFGCPGQEVRIAVMVRIKGLFHLLINGVYWDYDLLTNLLLTMRKRPLVV